MQARRRENVFRPPDSSTSPVPPQVARSNHSVTLREFARLALCPLVDGEGKDGQNSAPTLAQRGAQFLGPADESHARHMTWRGSSCGGRSPSAGEQGTASCARRVTAAQCRHSRPGQVAEAESGCGVRSLPPEGLGPPPREGGASGHVHCAEPRLGTPHAEQGPPRQGQTPLSRGARERDCARLCRETLYAVLRCADISACFASASAIWSAFHSGSRQRQK